MEDRYEVRSTIFLSQVPVKDWHELIPNKTIADAILDRVLHNSYRIELKGPSMRKKITLQLRRKKTNKRSRNVGPVEVASYCKNGRPVTVGIGGQLCKNTHHGLVAFSDYLYLFKSGTFDAVIKGAGPLH
jgi:hypothetical protein